MLSPLPSCAVVLCSVFLCTVLWYSAQYSYQLWYGTVLSSPMQYAMGQCLVFLCTILWYSAQSSYLLCYRTAVRPPVQCAVLCSVVLGTHLWDCAQSSHALCYRVLPSLFLSTVSWYVLRPPKLFSIPPAGLPVPSQVGRQAVIQPGTRRGQEPHLDS